MYFQGELVFVNYGTPEDWDYIMINASINITGKIVLSKYGKAFRGDLVSTSSPTVWRYFVAKYFRELLY